MSPENFLSLKKTIRKVIKLTLKAKALVNSDPCNKKQEAKMALLFKNLLKISGEE